MIIVGKHLKGYDNTIEINQLEIMVLLLILIITDPFNSKDKITGQRDDKDTIIVEIMVTLKYLSNFRVTLETLETWN